MSLTFGFYNSINGDRVYDAIQVSQIFDGIITDGVYATFMKGMVVKASSNASEVIVQPGRCWFNHTWTYIDADYPVEAPAPEVILDRVDALVIDINQENAFRENKLTWVQGTPASINPERPTLINTVTHHQYPLAYIYRKAGTTMIYAADITNAVGTSECPFVTGVLKGLDIDAWLAQWDDEFHTWENTTKTQFEGWMVNQQAVYNTWFNAIKGQMEGDLDDFEDWFETIQGIIDSEAATHLQQEIDDLNDRLPAGSFIEITTTESQLFNRNVTVSDGIHSKTVQFDAYGNATVESFPYVGLLTITSTDGVRTATESLSTPYYARYNVTLAFWSATVNLVGDSSATAGIVVSVYDSESAIPLTSITLDSQGRGSYTATYPDTYKFRYSYGGQTMEVSLAVTQETTYTVEIHAGFNYQAWLTAGRVSGTFASLDAILANEAALRQLMLVHDSVDYLADQMVNADVTKIFNNNLAAKWINNSDYALDKFYAVADIKTVMDTADKYGYGEWIITDDTTTPPTYGPKGNVPIMTANNAPYGEVSGSAEYSNYKLYYAFDGNENTKYVTTTANGYIQYKFTNPVCVKKFKLSDEATYYVKNGATIKGSNDGSTWETIYTFANKSGNVTNAYYDCSSNNKYFLYYRLTNNSNKDTQIYTLQFYGRSLSVSVPTMTSKTAPFGEVISKSCYQNNETSYGAWKAFSKEWGTTSSYAYSGGAGDSLGAYIGYKSLSKFVLKAVYHKAYYTAERFSSYKIQGSNTGYDSDWHDLSDVITTTASEIKITFLTTNTTEYKYHRIYQTVSTGGNVNINEGNLKFYGLDYSEKEFEVGTTKKWLYDHGVELETLDATRGIVTKNADSITLKVTSSSAASIGKNIDLTPYSLMRAKVGGFTTVYNYLVVSSNISSSTADASAQITSANAPNNSSLDVSAFNQTKAAFAQAQQVADATLELAELWLE